MNHSGLHAILFEWPLLVCDAIVFGLAAFAALVNAERAPAADVVRMRLLYALRFVALAALLWAPADLLHQAAEMAAVPITQTLPLLTEVMTQTHAGRIWIVRIAVLAAMTAIAWMRGAGRMKALELAVAAAVLFLLRALASHALDDGAFAIVLYVLHEMFAGVWLGSLLGIFVGYHAAGPADADAWFVATAPRVSRAAATSLAVLAATGAYAAYDGLRPHLLNLVYSSYGRVLIVKLAVSAIAVVIGGYNRVRLMPGLDDASARAALRNNVAAEVAILAVVLACSVVLAATPPAH